MDTGTLLKEHWQELLDLRDEFMGYALTTKRADREKLEHAIAGLYSFAGFDPPERVVWFSSPLEAVVAASLWIQMLSPENVSDSQVENVHRFLLTEMLYEHFSRADNFVPEDYEELLKALTSSLLITSTSIVPFRRVAFDLDAIRKLDVVEEHPMFARELAWRVRELLRGAVMDTVRQRTLDDWPDALLKPWNAVRAPLSFHHESWASLAKSLVFLDGAEREKFLRALNHRISLMTVPIWAHFSPLHYTFQAASRRALSIFGFDLTDKMPMPHWLEAVKAGGWWWPFQYICFACDNPTELHFDQNTRVHNENDMAIRFEDNWGFCALHGVRVPETVIQNRFSAADIDAEPNSEVRSRMIQRLGTEKYIMETGAQEIDRSEYGVLYRKEQPQSQGLRALEPIVMVKVTNKTPQTDGSFRTYFLRVPPNIRTAKEAVAWTFNLEEGEYRPDLES